jgi:lactate dehydrogenase-like 2-hydroxyacid dehydrogenase
VSQFTDALSSSVIAGLKGLGMIAHVGVGFDNIDVAAATANGIPSPFRPAITELESASVNWLTMACFPRARAISSSEVSPSWVSA